MRPSNPLEFTKYISPDGRVYNFDDGLDKFLISREGFGIPSFNYITERGPYQHGETVLDYRLSPRIVQLVHRVRGDCRDDFWANRAELLNSLRMNRQSSGEMNTGILRTVLDDGTKRDLNVLLAKGIPFSARDTGSWDENSLTEMIRFIAFDPVLFDPNELTVTFALSVVDHLVFPVSFVHASCPSCEDMLFGMSSIDETHNISYYGTWLSYPTLVLTGPMQKPSIINVTTDEKLELDYDVSVGETVTISLAYGNKTILNGSGVNLIGSLTTDSDLATFHIAPSPEALNGINALRVVFGGATAASTIYFTYFTKYIGI